jgi:hypothetical protein
MLVVRGQQVERALDARPNAFPEVVSTVYSHPGFCGIPRPKVQRWEERVELRQSGKVEQSTTGHTLVDFDQRVFRLTHLMTETDASGKRKLSEQWSIKALGGVIVAAWGRQG